jgi:isopenicillin N synthase-like dioxygenase
MLQRLTNGRLRSTTHRVINPVGERARHRALLDAVLPPLPPDFLIEALDQCVDEDAADEVESPITAHDYLMERLREINLV